MTRGAIAHAALLSVFAFVVLGCAAAPLTPPSEGGPAWRELRTEHFVTKTDLDDAAAEQAARELEDRYRALEDVAFPRNPAIPIRPIDVVFFRSGAEYKIFGLPNTIGLWSPKRVLDVEPRPTILVPREFERAGGHPVPEEEILTAVTHELTHDFMHRAFGAVPVWFGEGLADYYSTIRVDGDSIVTGELSPIRVKPIGRGLFPPLEVLLRAPRRVFYANGAPPESAGKIAAGFYAEAAVFVAMLNDPAGPYFSRYVTFVKALQSNARPAAAMAAAFGDLSDSRLNEDLLRYISKEQHTAFRRPRKQHDAVRIDARRLMTEAEVPLLWARLADWPDAKPSYRAYHELEIAERLAPDAEEVLLARTRYLEETGQLGAARAAVERALKVNPASAVALVALVHLDAGQRDETAARRDLPRLEAVAASATELNIIATYKGALGDRGGALTFAKRAIAVDPSCAECFAVFGDALAAANQLKSASAAEERAIALLPDGVVRPAWAQKLDTWSAAGAPAADQAGP